MTTLLWIIAIPGSLILLIYLRYFIPLRPKQPGFEYVFIDKDGSVRELDQEEREYLSIEFESTDSGRPFIKSRFYSRFFGISGYIRRRRVPFWIKINPLYGNQALTVRKCKECQKEFFVQTSRLLNTCSDCSQQLYGFEKR